MKTSLTPIVQQTAWGQKVNEILRNCVHCGFCTAVCPTYQLLGNELDSPRGRVYLLKSFFEGHPISFETQRHLDLCLTCRACENNCPSGVQYGQLIDIGRGLIEEQVDRPLLQSLFRWGVRQVLTRPVSFNTLLWVGQLLRPTLPQKLRRQIPPRIQIEESDWPEPSHARNMIVLEGCVQPNLAPNINLAAAQVLDKLGITLLQSTSGCCGALNYHLSVHEEGFNQMQQMIDEWWPFLETGTEALVVTASGCGTLIKEYGHLFQEDPVYAEKATRVSESTFDISEILAREDLSVLQPTSPPPESAKRVALHTPCSLQHGQKLGGVIEPLLTRFGYELTHVPDSHLCCGSAGAYSLLNRKIAQPLRTNKLVALQSDAPQVIATANIGCQMHLQTQALVPVKHWIQLVAERLI